jgi:hypothetical protein
MIVQSLWVGNKLSRMEYYSILSFLKLGYTFHLYTYEKVENVPKGTTVMDGNKIMSKEEIFQLKSTYLPFADIFRYKMLYLNGGYWVDLDMIAIKQFDFKSEYVFSSERTIQKGAYRNRNFKYVANIGVLKAPKGSPFYLDLYNRCMEVQKRGTNKDKLRYMRILRDMIFEYKLEKSIYKPDDFCHLDWWYAKDAFIPNYNVSTTGRVYFKSKYGVHEPRGLSLSSMTTKPYTIHFWRDLVKNKYKLDLDGEYDPQSLWEILIKRIDAM